jgi:hypothetical protein
VTGQKFMLITQGVLASQYSDVAAFVFSFFFLLDTVYRSNEWAEFDA